LVAATAMPPIIAALGFSWFARCYRQMTFPLTTRRPPL